MKDFSESLTRLRVELFLTALLILVIAQAGDLGSDAMILGFVPIGKIPQGLLFAGLYLFIIFVAVAFISKHYLNRDHTTEVLSQLG